MDSIGLSEDEVDKEDCWPQSVAVGSRSFVEAFKAQMGSSAIGRNVREKAEGFELREPQSPYRALSGTEKNDIGGKNLLFWCE